MSDSQRTAGNMVLLGIIVGLCQYIFRFSEITVVVIIGVIVAVVSMSKCFRDRLH